MKTNEFILTKEMSRIANEDLDKMTLKQINLFADTLRTANKTFDNFIKINIYKVPKSIAIEIIKGEWWLLKEIYKYFGLKYGETITIDMLQEFYEDYWSYCEEIGIY